MVNINYNKCLANSYIFNQKEDLIRTGNSSFVNNEEFIHGLEENALHKIQIARYK